MGDDVVKDARPGLPPVALGADELMQQLRQGPVDANAALESLVTSMARGEVPVESFALLHEAAARDGQIRELSTAYERIANETRFKLLDRDRRAAFLLQAARFAADVPRDWDAALAHLERAVAVAPPSGETLDLLDRVLAAVADGARAVELYRQVTQHRSIDALALFRRALAVIDAIPSSNEHAMAVRERIIKLDPSDAKTRTELAREYVDAGRHRDLAKMLEEVLAKGATLAEEDAPRIRERLVAMYRDVLGEPQRALPHLEQLLRADPVSEWALEAAESVIESRLLGSRIAPLLADAYARLRRPHDELSVLVRELKIARPPRRGEVQRRLAFLRLDVLDDVQGALELLTPLVASDPGDDLARRRYLEITSRENLSQEAARLLSRALQSAKDAAVRARVGYDLAALFAALGDSAAAQAAFEQVAKSEADPDVALASARRLLDLLGPSADPRKLARALEIVTRLEPDPKRRHQAAKRLSDLSDQYKLGSVYSVAAWRALVDSPEGEAALERLERWSEESGDRATLAEVLELKLERTADPEQARALSFRAAELRATGAPIEVALEAWKNQVKRHGASRPAYAHIAELYEQQGNWEQLATLLDADARLARADERAPIYARLGRIKLEHLGDALGALQAFRQALGVDPKEPTSRASVEKLLHEGELRLEAARIIEPIYRAERRHQQLLELLQTRAGLLSNPAERLECFARAADLLEEELDDPLAGVEICRQALSVAAASDRKELSGWFERLQHFASAGGHTEQIAEIVLEVLGDGDTLEAELTDFALIAAEVLSEAGNIERAGKLLERALTEDPTSPQLLGRVDAIAARRGIAAEERVARYHHALELRPPADRWRKLMQAAAEIERRDLGSPDAAAATLRQIAEHYPDDYATHSALLELFEEIGGDAELTQELERGLARFSGTERQRTLVRMIEKLVREGELERAVELCKGTLEDWEVDEAVLDVAERLFRETGDVESLQRVLERRVQAVTEPGKQADAYERLGSFLLEDLGDSKGAVEAWRTGAQRCRELESELERARRLYERILDAFPNDAEAAERLVELYAAEGQWSKVPEVYATVVRVGGGHERGLDVLLELAPRAAQAGAVDEFIALADEIQWQLGRETSGLGRKLLAAKARVLAASGYRQRDAGEMFQNLVEAYGEEEDVASYQRFIDETPDEDERRASLRWLYGWQSKRVANPLTVLFEWAEIEEKRFSDPLAAIKVYERIVQSDAQNRPALEALVRLQLDAEQIDPALDSLEALRRASDSKGRSEIDLRMAELAMSKLGKPARAVEYLSRAIGETGPTEAVLDLARRLLLETESRVPTVRLLEQAASRARARDAELILTLLIEDAEDLPELRDSRLRWWTHMLELHARYPARALPMALRAAAERPELDEGWSKAEDIAKGANELPSVAQAMQRALDEPLDAATAERIGRRAADLFDKTLGDPSGAAAVLGRVLALSPKARWALDRVKVTLSLQRRHEELLELFDRAIAAETDVEARADLLDEAALVAKDLANAPDAAIGYLEKLLELRPSDARIEATLERLYERQGHSNKLIELLQSRLSGLSVAEATRSRARIAELWLDLGEPKSALSTIESMLGGKAEPLASALLEKLLKQTTFPQGQSLEAIRDVQRRAAELLAEEYARANRPSDVVRVLEQELELYDDSDAKVQRLRQIVALRLDQLRDEAGALEALSALVGLEPDVAEHRNRARELAVGLGVESKLADVLVRAAEESDPPRIALVLEAAELYAGRLRDADRAAELYRSVLERGERDRAIASQAARALEHLLAVQGRPGERCTVLEQLAALTEDPRENAAALYEAARVALEELEDPERSARNCRTLLERSPRDAKALDGLIQALRAAGRHRELAEALETRARLVTDKAAARRDRVRAAHLYADEIGDLTAAAQTWRKIRNEYGADPQSYEALHRVYERERATEKLVPLIEEEARAENQPDRRRQLYLELARVHMSSTRDVIGALFAFVQADDFAQAIAAADGARDDERVGKPALRSLFELSTKAWQSSGKSADSPAAQAALWAARTLASTLAFEGDHAGAVKTLLDAAALPFDRGQRRELEREAAWTAGAMLGDEQHALELLRKLFAEDSFDEVAQAAEQQYSALLERAELPAERAELIERLGKHARDTGDEARARELFTTAAEIWESSAGDIERAIACHRRAAKLRSEPSLDALGRLYRAQGDVRRAAEVLDQLLERAPVELRAERAVSAADAYIELGERAVARARLDQALHAGADPKSIRPRLATLYRTEHNFSELSRLLVEQAREETDPARRCELFVEAADLYLDELGDPPAAVPLVEAALETIPDNVELQSKLATLLGRAGRTDDAIALLQRRVEAFGARRPKERADVHRRLGELLAGAGRTADAISEFERAVGIDSGRTDVLYRLGRLLHEDGRLQDAEQSYRTLLLAMRRPGQEDRNAPTRAEVYLGLSDIMERRGDAARANDYLDSAFEAALDDPREAEGLERQLRAAGRDDLLARSLEARLMQASYTPRAALLLEELVNLTRDKLSDDAFVGRIRNRAESLRVAFEAERADEPRAWGALQRVFRFIGDETAAVAVTQHWLKATERSAELGADELYEIAEVCLSSPERATAGVVLLERALALRPEPDRALELLRPAVDAEPANVRAVRLFETMSRAPGREAMRAHALAKVAALPDATPHEVRSAVEQALAVGDRALARTLLEARAARTGDGFSPDDRAFILARLAQMAAEDGRYAAAAELSERAAATAPETPQATEHWRRAAQLSSRLGDHTRALSILSQLIERNPSDASAWETVLDLRKKGARAEAVAALIAKRAPQAQPAELRARLLLERTRLLLAINATDEALEALRNIVESDPGQLEAAELLSELLEKAGRVDELAEALDARIAAARTRDDTKQLAQLLSRLGALLERAGQNERAAEAYGELLRIAPDDLEALRAVARTLVGTDSETLATALERLAKLEKGVAAIDAALQLAALRTEQGAEGAAERALLIGFESDPKDARIISELSSRYTSLAQWSKLVDLLERALASKPGDRELVLRLSDAYRRGGQLDRALEVLDRGNKSDAEIAHQRFVVLQSGRRHEQALEALEHAARLDAHYVDDLAAEIERAAATLESSRFEARMLGLVDLVDQNGDAARARALLERLAQANPPPRAALERLAKLKAGAGEWTDAMSAYRRLLSLDLGDGVESAALALADACEKAGRAADARADLERALEKAPRSAKLLARLRKLYETIGARDQLARTYLSEASEQADALARVGALVNAGSLMLEAGNGTQAVAVLERAHSQEPAHVEAALLLARALRRSGQRERALQALTETAARHERSRSKDVARLKRYIADLHLEQDELVEALHALEGAFEIDKSDPGLALSLGLLAIDLDAHRTAQQALQAVTMARSASKDSTEPASAETRSTAYYHLGWLAHIAGDAARMRQMAQRALKEDPANQKARALLDEVGPG